VITPTFAWGALIIYSYKRNSPQAAACHVALTHAADGHVSEVEDPALRIVVLCLCVAVVEADDHVADRDLIALESTAERWGLHRQHTKNSH
jgi:hypothetical protein